MTEPPSPLASPARGLDPSWFDYNGHLNMAYYNVLLDQAVDHAFEAFGCGPHYRATRNLSFFTAEAHVRYIRELKPGSLVHATLQILDYDAKRLHIWQELFHEEGWLSATSENLMLHVDMAGPKVAPMPDDIFAQVEAAARAHAALQRPAAAGTAVGIRRKPE